MGEVGSEKPARSTSLFLQIVENPDGAISRPSVPLAPPTPEASDSAAVVLSKDVPLNSAHNTWLRIYRPNAAASPCPEKLPIIVYFHGGGFVVFSAATVFYHQFCEQMSAAVPALVVSLDYRLAPESRLPAAYDDAVEALLWLQAQAKDPAAGDPWLAGHGDFSRCFVMGQSSGGNMAYQAGLRATALDLQPIQLAGLVLNQPYFGGVERAPSELQSEEDIIIPLRANDNMWRLSLPKGADRDHEYCNPAASPPPPGVSRLPRCLVKGYRGDPLLDRQKAFAGMLEGAGASVVARLEEQGIHAIELFDPTKAQALLQEVKEFVCA